ncbi:uncharacterized protein B0P05DRAFT_7647 [Gilbertella persicaria]|uniref:uncharacterized protein n=1 Tax=Gilbertella persicaria TaxID=101096 RepID=UPI0022211C67|nr:uncharacterized protein B0P05DRAFT_7647 [Gilbertella persicaria]KAI8098339.1 hypothetical protein B0P05DRAFT_7647 [Gilbertella persicaria]
MRHKPFFHTKTFGIIITFLDIYGIKINAFCKCLTKSIYIHTKTICIGIFQTVYRTQHNNFDRWKFTLFSRSEESCRSHSTIAITFRIECLHNIIQRIAFMQSERKCSHCHCSCPFSWNECFILVFQTEVVIFNFFSLKLSFFGFVLIFWVCQCLAFLSKMYASSFFFMFFDFNHFSDFLIFFNFNQFFAFFAFFKIKSFFMQREILSSKRSFSRIFF